jgi:Ca2+/Na+ antiporter
MAKLTILQSRGTAVILLFVYACYLTFQLKTHTTMYNAPSQKVEKRKSSKKAEGDAARGIAAIGAGTAAASGGGVNVKTIFKNPDENHADNQEEEEFETPSLSVVGALVTLAISTTLVAFCSEFMVDSIDGLTKTGGVSTTFVGLILLPIVGNAAEHATAVTVAIKDKMDLSIGVAVGSSMQIALLVFPVIVILGWILGKDCMTLYFDTFQIATLFVSVLLVNYLIQDGKSRKSLVSVDIILVVLTLCRLARRCPTDGFVHHHSSGCMVLPQHRGEPVLDAIVSFVPIHLRKVGFCLVCRYPIVYPVLVSLIDEQMIIIIPLHGVSTLYVESYRVLCCGSVASPMLEMPTSTVLLSRSCLLSISRKHRPPEVSSAELTTTLLLPTTSHFARSIVTLLSTPGGRQRTQLRHESPCSRNQLERHPLT